MGTAVGTIKAGNIAAWEIDRRELVRPAPRLKAYSCLTHPNTRRTTDMIVNTQEHEARRLAYIRDAEKLIDRAEKAERDLTKSERGDFDRLLEKAENERTGPDARRAIGKLPDSDIAFRHIDSTHSTHSRGENPMYQSKNQYSLARAIRAAASNDWSDAPLERQASQETAEMLGRSPRGFFLPVNALAEQRDLTKGTAADGGYTVATDLLSQSFIDMLRNRMVTQMAGATVLAGLVGDVAIPRQTGGATAYWVTESGSPTESKQAFDQVPMTPKTVGAFTDISRKLLLQSSIDVEAFVRNDLASVLALAIDSAALHGPGSSNQPTGIASTSGIGSVAGGTNGAAPTWAHIVELESDVSVANADIGKLGYVTNTKVRGKLKTTQKAASTDSTMLWDNNSSPLNGYPAHVSNQVRSDLTKGSATDCSAIFFGNWADLLIGLWGTLDLLVDPYSGSTHGSVRVVALQDVDIAVRHSESFALFGDVLTA